MIPDMVPSLIGTSFSIRTVSQNDRHANSVETLLSTQRSHIENFLCEVDQLNDLLEVKAACIKTAHTQVQQKLDDLLELLKGDPMQC